VYDMYPWNEPDSGANHDQEQKVATWLPAPRNGAAPRDSAAPRNSAAPRSGTAPRHANGTRHANGGDVPADFTQAVQFALDRRDNGGDAIPARQPATPPAASLTPQ
jgi:hypothetical protein